MGDIIWGTFIFILSLAVFALYLFLTRKKKEQRSLTKFISILLMIGGVFGVLITSLNSSLLYDHPTTYFLSLFFFVIQTFAGDLYYRGIKVGLPLLMLTLLLQIPVIYSFKFSYRSQTLVSLNFANYPRKILDIEPGSYIHFTDARFAPIGMKNLNSRVILGFNLVPLLTIALYWRKIRQSYNESVSGHPSSP